MTESKPQFTLWPVISALGLAVIIYFFAAEAIKISVNYYVFFLGALVGGAYLFFDLARKNLNFAAAFKSTFTVFLAMAATVFLFSFIIFATDEDFVIPFNYTILIAFVIMAVIFAAVLFKKLLPQINQNFIVQILSIATLFAFIKFGIIFGIILAVILLLALYVSLKESESLWHKKLLLAFYGIGFVVITLANINLNDFNAIFSSNVQNFTAWETFSYGMTFWYLLLQIILVLITSGVLSYLLFVIYPSKDLLKNNNQKINQTVSNAAVLSGNLVVAILSALVGVTLLYFNHLLGAVSPVVAVNIVLIIFILVNKITK